MKILKKYDSQKYIRENSSPFEPNDPVKINLDAISNYMLKNILTVQSNALTPLKKYIQQNDIINKAKKGNLGYYVKRAKPSKFWYALNTKKLDADENYSKDYLEEVDIVKFSGKLIEIPINCLDSYKISFGSQTTTKLWKGVLTEISNKLTNLFTSKGFSVKNNPIILVDDTMSFKVSFIIKNSEGVIVYDFSFNYLEDGLSYLTVEGFVDKFSQKAQENNNLDILPVILDKGKSIDLLFSNFIKSYEKCKKTLMSKYGRG